ncbi:hypothetical protein DEALK_06800 [Dehalogenimonas alkenigignens]|uniref:Uncharacterized protein n=1 Tax=Dehalogenimonas alkenigignens TaxID=1217799 RepID=A0A0W0GH10_9CHLR|nr:hypothetical protein [Dehalogenimonas alkenigignens]KTB47835.1 hypothetical protein DEALK_06800 [Dehalogenimonas alkenigignens]
MALKKLELELKPFTAQGESAIALAEDPALPGWYVDPVTGQRVFFDPVAGKFFTVAGGVYIPLGYMNPAPKQVAVAPGDRLMVSISFKYTGPAISGVTGYYCIGTNGMFGFDEKLVQLTTFSIPQVTSPPSYPNVTNSFTFTIPSNVDTNWDDIYVKIFGGTPSIGGQATTNYLFGYENALLVAGIQPTISEFKISDFAKV